MSEQEPKPPKVIVVEVKRLDKPGNLKAYASIKIGPLTIHSCSLVQQTGQTAWVSPPQSSWKDSHGKTHYNRLLEWPKSWNDAIRDAVMEVYEAETYGGHR